MKNEKNERKVERARQEIKDHHLDSESPHREQVASLLKIKGHFPEKCHFGPFFFISKLVWSKKPLSQNFSHLGRREVPPPLCKSAILGVVRCQGSKISMSWIWLKFFLQKIHDLRDLQVLLFLNFIDFWPRYEVPKLAC